jgi:hypothetical protein
MNRRTLFKVVPALAAASIVGVQVSEKAQAKYNVDMYVDHPVYTLPSMVYLRDGQEVYVKWIDKYSFFLELKPDEVNSIHLFSRGEVEPVWADRAVGQKAFDYELEMHLDAVQRLYDKSVKFGGVNANNYEDWQQYLSNNPY